MRALLALLLLAVTTPDALAKCGARFYVVSGTVVTDRGTPASNVLVGVSWIEQSLPSGPAMALTDQNGHYSIPIRVDTYSGSSLLGDRCGAVLKQLSVAAYTGTQRSGHLLVPVGKSSQLIAALIKIDRPIEREPLWPDEVGG